MACRARTREAGQRLTLEEYEDLPREDAHRVSLVRGLLVREPRPGGLHASITTRVVAALEARVRRTGGATVLTEGGFVLSTDPPTVRGPDLAVVSHQHLPPEAIPLGLVRLAPDLAVEITSPSNTAKSIREKIAEYFDAGTRMVWVIHPARREVSLYRSRTDPQILDIRQTIDADDVIPGLRVPVSEIFGAASASTA